jgi:hypothetical protein
VPAHRIRFYLTLLTGLFFTAKTISMSDYHLTLTRTKFCPEPQFTLCKWCCSWMISLVVLLGLTPAVAQQIDNVHDYQLKVVFIYNFSKFIEWPDTAFADSNASFQVCVVGENPFGESLQSLNNRQYRTHPIVIKFPQTIAEAKNCHILYVGDINKSAQWRDLVKNLGDTPVLTVSSSSDAAESGIGIGFVTRDGKIRWDLNLNATRKAQLKVSAKLVEIAASIIGEVPR